VITLPRLISVFATIALIPVVYAEAPAAAVEVETEEERIARWFHTGKLAEGTSEANAYVSDHPDDANARFQLGVLKFLRAVERFGQTQYRYGLSARNTIIIPFVRIPVPKNDDSDEIGYEDLRQVLTRFVDDLGEAEQALADVGDTEVKLRIDLREIHFDFDKDGHSGEAESLWSVFSTINRRAARDAPADGTVAFDSGDVEWLRGYCHLLQGLGNAVLAHDFQELHRRCGHLFYPRVKSQYEFLQHQEGGNRNWSVNHIADLISLVHLINFEVVEPERMQRAQKHLLEMIKRSRASWEKILAETDDDREWLPGPTQKAALTSVRITGPMVESWHTFLDESESLLTGKKLVPFWRATKAEVVAGTAKGLNLHRVFKQPRRFDLVLWAQGTAAVPYLEQGELTDQRVWTQLTGAFRGQFWGFAIWIN